MYLLNAGTGCLLLGLAEEDQEAEETLQHLVMIGPGPGHHLLHGLVVGGVPVPSEGGDPAPVVELDVPMDTLVAR